MSKREQRGRRALRELIGEVAWELVIAAVIAVLVFAPLPSIDLPAIDLPSVGLPNINLPDWVGTVFKWGKFLLLGALALAFVIGALNRRLDRPSDVTAEGSS